MESLDSREAITDLVLELLAEDEFRDGPSAGVVLQAYLRDAPELADRLLAFAASAGRTHPLVVRLVKGAYWDHEVVEARQHGWEAPVFEEKADSRPHLRGAHPPPARGARRSVRVGRSPATTCAPSPTRSRSTARLGADDRDVELQVLRGLGDDLQDALAARGFRVRTYCPVGDLVAGMAYLVRRLLENTSNESFLARRRPRGRPLEELLAAP